MLRAINNYIINAISNIEMRKSDLFLPFFSMLFIAAHIGTNIYSPRLVSFNFLDVNFTVGGGIFIFPFTFFVLDTVTEYFGMTKAIILVISNIIVLGLASLFFWYTNKIPTNNPAHINEHYQFVLNPFVRAFLATSSSNIVAYIFNILFLDKMRKRYGIGGKAMFYRLVFVTAFAEIVYSFVWCSIDMIGTVNVYQFSQIVGSNFIVKIVFQIISTPFTIGIVKILRNIDNRETLQVKNPFLDEENVLKNIDNRETLQVKNIFLDEEKSLV